MNKLKRRLDFGYIYNNRSRILINLCFVILGVLAGCALFLYFENDGFVYERLKEILSEIERSEKKKVFINAVVNNSLVCGIFFAFSMFHIGSFLSPVYVFVRCIAYGFTSSIIISAYKWTGVLILAVGVVPQTIFYICGIIILSVETAKQSKYISSCYDKILRKQSIITYYSVCLIPIFLLVCGCVVEGFVSPHTIWWCLKKV